MIPAGTLSVLVTASTGKANAALAGTRSQFRATAASAQSSSASTAAAWKSAGKAIGVGAALVTAASAKMAIDFDKEMRNVNSIAQLPEKQFQKLSKSALDMASDVAQAPVTIAEGMYTLVSSGFSAAESLSIVRESAKGATAGLTDTATSTKSVAAVLNAYRLPAKDAASVTDTLFRTVDRGVISFEELAQNIGDTLPFAATMGIELKELGASAATMTKQGLGVPETMTRIRNVIQTLIKPGKDLDKTFQTMGTSGEDLVNKLGFQGALDEIISTTDGTKESLAKLFPNIRALGGVMALTGENSEAAAKDLLSMKDAAGATDKALSQQSQSTAYQWNKAKAELSELAIEWGQVFLPILGKGITVLVAVGHVLADVAHWLSNLPPEAAAVAGAMAAAALAAKGLMVLVPLGSAAVAVAGAFTAAAGAGTLLATVGTGLALAFRAHPLLMIATGVGLATGAVIGLTKAFGGLFSSEKEIPKMQTRLKETSAAMTGALEKQTSAVGAMADSSKKVRKAQQREREASRAVVKSEESLADIRRKYPAHAMPVIKAQARLVEAKREERRANKQLEKSEREQGAMRAASKPIFKETLSIERDRINTLKEQRDNLQKTLATQVKYKASTEDLSASQDKIRENTKQLVQARRAEASTLREATERIGPKFSRAIDQSVTAMTQFGTTSKQIVTHLKNPWKNTIFESISYTQRFGREARDLGGAFQASDKVGTGAINSLNSSTQKAANSLNLSIPSFGTSSPKKKRVGGMVPVPGVGSGDKVPVHVGGMHVADTEPGELIGVINRNAAAQVNAINGAVPRFAGGGVTNAFGSTADVMGSGPGFIPYMNYLNSLFGPLNVISGSRPGSIVSGSSSLSNHSWGGAVDISTPGGEGATSSSPMSGSLESRMDAAYAHIQKYFSPINLDTLWETMTGGNHYNHIHSGIARSHSFDPEAMRAFISKLPEGGGFGGIPKLKITGPDGPLKAIPQAIADMVHKGATQLLNKATDTPQFGGQDMGNVHGETFMSSSYGPPWGGINGTGVTATGVDLSNSPAIHGIAVDPSVIPLGSQVRISPNPHNYGGAFKAFDTGGAIQGNRIDFYDWRGREEQMGWGMRPVQLEALRKGGVLGLQDGGVFGPIGYTPEGTHPYAPDGNSVVDNFAKQYMDAAGKGDKRELVSDFSKRIKGNRFGVDFLSPDGSELSGNLKELRTMATLFNENSGYAATLTKGNPNPDLPDIQGLFQRLTEAQWLGGFPDAGVMGELPTLWALRNKLVNSHGSTSEVLDTVKKMVRDVEQQLKKAQQHIKTLNREKRKLEEERKKLDQDLNESTKAYEKSREVTQKALEKEKAKPKKKQDAKLIASLQAALEKKDTKSDAIRKAIDKNQNKQQQVGGHIGEWDGLRGALKDRIQPAVADRQSSLDSGLATIQDELRTVQGGGHSLKPLVDLPELGMIGGEIFTAQHRLYELGLPPEVSDPNANADNAMNIQDLMQFADAVRLGAFGPSKALQGFAKGGYPHGLSVVGERGPELVDFRGGGSRVFSNQQSQNMGPSTLLVEKIMIGDTVIAEHVEATIKEMDSKSQARYRAGRRS